jgi:hypothetical protein
VDTATASTGGIMKRHHLICLAAVLLLAVGCNIQFASPEFPKDTGGDTISGDTGIDAVVPDGVDPDTPEPDLKGKVCVDLEGLCVSEVDDFEVNIEGCPWGYEHVEIGGCGGDERCCIVSDECSGEGTLFDVQDEGIGCCPWLGSRDVCHVVGQESCDCPGEKYVCTDCGNATCEEWENPCSCPEDCDFGGNECKENGGECSPGCPDGHQVLDLEGCPDGAFCCELEGECLGEGASAEDAPGTPPCCDGLSVIQMTLWLGGTDGQLCQEDDAAIVCSKCGNNACENWESWCTCPDDCDKPDENICALEGHSCKGFCPQGWTPNGLPGCAPGKKCCEENGEECLGAGEGVDDIMPVDLACCEGLGMIENLWVGEDGECEIGPGFYCSACGNWECEPWENECSCPADCGITPPEWCDPSGNDSANCPSDMFCAGPAYACDVDGLVGTCVDTGGVCPEIFMPVCTCKGNDYDNECLAWLDQEQVAWYGNCMDPDGQGCIGLGEVGGTDEFENLGCCGDLEKMDMMSTNGDECVPEPGIICVKCGDGVCGAGEDSCICQDDCPNIGTPGGNP